MRQFYLLIEKGARFGHQLSWSHYTELLSIKDERKLNYYINISIKNNLSKRQLREKIKTNEYEPVQQTIVIEPYAVVSYALKNAISIAGMLLSIQHLVVNDFQEKAKDYEM